MNELLTFWDNKETPDFSKPIIIDSINKNYETITIQNENKNPAKTYGHELLPLGFVILLVVGLTIGIITAIATYEDSCNKKE